MSLRRFINTLPKLFSLHPLLMASTSLIALIVVSEAVLVLLPISETKNTVKPQNVIVIDQPKTTPKAKSTTPVPTPANTTEPTPVATTTPTVAKSAPVAVTHSVSVVKPAPSSSVSGLSPVSTGSGGSNSSGNSTGNSNSSNDVIGYKSTNWSGYMSTGGSYSAITATWVADKVTGNNATTSADATWIGIGGIVSGDLIQVGTQNTVSSSGQVATSAFYELLPNREIVFPDFNIAPGDTISATINQINSSVWTITISDLTTNATFATNVNYASSNSSAEWIEEDPSYASGGLVPIDNFDQISFLNCSTINNGNSDNLNQTNAQSITMFTPAKTLEALPSAIDPSGDSFSVSYQ